MDSRYARLLKVDENTPVITMDVSYYDNDFRTVMFSREYWRSDKFHINISLNKIPEGRRQVR